jgi:PAS domain S-box-containing protein
MVEDSESDATLTLHELRRNDYDVTFERVYTAAAMSDALDGKQWDIVLSDYSMPAFSAPDALKLLQEKNLDLPFIIVSGTIGEETAVAALKAGAHDFFSKQRLILLAPAVERELREAEDRRQRRQVESELNALYNASAYLFKSESLVALGRQIVTAVTAEFGYPDCGLILLDPKHSTLTRLARAGTYEVVAETPLVRSGRGLVPEAARTGQIVYAPDVTANPLYIASDSRTRSELAVPLRTAKGMVGVLDLQSPEPDAYSQRDQRILAAFAERAASAIEIFGLYEAINRHAADLESRVAQRTAELQHAKERVEAILNNSSDAIVLAHTSRGIQQANPAFYALFGYATDELFGHPLSVIAETRQAAAFQQDAHTVETTGQLKRLDMRCVRKDGSVFDGDVMLTLVKGNTENAQTLICSIRDNTQRKRVTDELRQALSKEKELNELKTRFVSMVSHEFRTPMATIQSSLDLVRTYGERMTPEKRREHFDKAFTEIRHLTDLLDDVLTISRADSIGLEFSPTALDLGTLCRHVVEQMQQIAPAHQINLVTTGSTQTGLADEKLLRQVMTNLLSNAVKYSAQGSSVHVRLTCDKKQATIEIRDEGIGIPYEDQDHLFELFHRAANVGNIQGSGLGLAIVKRAVEAHGGTINFISTERVGTTFTVSIPYVPSV